MGVQDISWTYLALGYLLLLLPLWMILHYKMGNERDLMLSMLRMTVQLLLVGSYLEYIFEKNNWMINLCWVLVMLLVSAFTVTRRLTVKHRYLFLSLFLASLLCMLMVDFFMAVLVVRLPFPLDARYLVPISGMLLGNIISDLVVSLETYYSSFTKQITTYRFALANGASHSEALVPFVRSALKISMNRGLATTSVMGLVSLPGMMTGQILGGSTPSVAIKYQILIMILIFVCGSCTIFLSLLFSRKSMFDAYYNLKP